MILAVDPGPVESAFVAWDGESIIDKGKMPNDQMLQTLIEYVFLGTYSLHIEMIASYGMAVGASVFETCVWIGRFMQAWGEPVARVPRIKVKAHLCHSAKAKDSNVRQALIDRLGEPGKKACPGVTFGVSGDEWAALALAVYAHDTSQGRPMNGT